MRLDHVVMPIADAERSLAFYRGLLGLPLIAAHEGDDWGGLPWLMMIFGLSDGREMVLVACRGGAPLGHGMGSADLRHYALSVETRADYDAWLDRIAPAGLGHWEEEHGERRSLYFPDPDGVILEITFPPAEATEIESGSALERAKAWITRSQVLTA